MSGWKTWNKDKEWRAGWKGHEKKGGGGHKHDRERDRDKHGRHYGARD